MEDDACTSHPSNTIDNTSIVIVYMLLDKDRQMMVWEMERASGIPKTTIHHIVTKYLMKEKVAVCWVPHTLFTRQKHHIELCQKHLTHYEKEGIVFLQRVIAIDETCVRDFERELKSQNEVWKGKNSPRPQKF